MFARLRTGIIGTGQQTSDGAEQISLPTSKVSVLPITQATTETFTDFYFRLTFLFFIQAGNEKGSLPYCF